MSDSEELRTFLFYLINSRVDGKDISGKRLKELYDQAGEDVKKDPDRCRKEVAEWREKIRGEDPFLSELSAIYEAL